MVTITLVIKVEYNNFNRDKIYQGVIFAIVRRVDDNVTTQPIDGDPLDLCKSDSKQQTANSKEDEYDDRNDFTTTVHRVFRNTILRSLQYRALLFQKGAIARLSYPRVESGGNSEDVSVSENIEEGYR